MSSNASVTRRSFIAAAGGTAALAAEATLTTAALADEAAGFDETYDVVVIGYGAAGGTAAFYAAKNGAKVLLVDSAPEGEEGGNSRFCGQNRSGAVRTRIADFLLAHGLRQSGAIVAPCVLPVRGKVYTRLYVPVEATGLKGKLELARLG